MAIKKVLQRYYERAVSQMDVEWTKRMGGCVTGLCICTFNYRFLAK